MSIDQVISRARASLIGLYIGDALAMPVHWYYDLGQLQRDFGKITKYEAPKKSFRGSIMNLSNTGGGGRGSDKGSIVGDVILHGKKKYWLRGGNFHYHHGMSAGDNTLEALISRIFVRKLTESSGKWTPETKLNTRDEFIRFLTTPGSHNDVYASTYIRMFFANRQNGLPLDKCPDNDGHNVDAIDALTCVVPVVVAGFLSEMGSSVNAGRSSTDLVINEDEIVESAIRSTTMLRNSPRVLPGYTSLFARLLLSILRGKDLRESVEAAGRSIRIDVPRMVASSRNDPMTACYLDSSVPALLHFAYKYADSPEDALLASANAGGENVARGALLGAIMGAAHGLEGLPATLISGLTATAEVQTEVNALVTSTTRQSDFEIVPSTSVGKSSAAATGAPSHLTNEVCSTESKEGGDNCVSF